MFSFFKINDPYRLIAIFLIAFAIKTPFFINACSYFEMHHWLIIGQAMETGHMYEQIFDSLAPLASTTYWLIEAIFGKSILALQILGTLLLVVQSVIFNKLTINNKVYEQNSYLPAFSFVILSSVHYSLSVFSPAQLGMTFILLAFSKLLSHVEFRAKRDEQITSIGLLIGIAVLFYLPYLLFLIVVLVIMVLFTNTLKRRYFILIISAFIPLLLAYVYYWLILDEVGFISSNFIIPTLIWDLSIFTLIWQNINLFLPLLLVWLLGLVTMPKQRRLNNYQTRLTQLFFLSGVLSLSILTFKDTGIEIGLIIIVPIAAFYATHMFYLIKRPITDLGVSLVFISVVLITSFDSEFNFLGLTNRIEASITVDEELASFVQDKSLMVLGDKPQLYQHGSLATPFYDWALAEPIIDHLEFYDNLVFIEQSINLYQPEIIIDYELKWGIISNHIPVLNDQYIQARPFIWIRVE